MEGEISSFINVWLTVVVSLCYCYAIGKTIPRGKTRFLLILPIVCLFFYLPLHLSTIHLCGITSFFIAWLANFKLLLFAFGRGPLSNSQTGCATTCVANFVALSCFPIKFQQNPPPKSHHQKYPCPQYLKGPKKSILNYAIKGVVLAMLVRVYDYNHYLHPKLVLVLYCLHIYFFLDVMLAMVAALARTMLGVEVEPQFNDPYLSTSLQDFWGRRWNLMVSSILRPTVYDPALSTFTRVIGREWAPIPAIWSTFFVSAFMHELIFYYLARTRPTWEVSRFFVLHGFCLTAEIGLKKLVRDRWRLPRLLAQILTVGFVMVTGFWLFFPQFLGRCRADVRAFEEYAALRAFVKNSSRALFEPDFGGLKNW